MEVINLRRLDRAEMMSMAIESSLQSCILLNFYQDPSRVDTTEVQLGDAVAIAMKEAKESGDSLILVEHSVPVIAKWTGLVHGERYTFRLLPTGRWRPVVQ